MSTNTLAGRDCLRLLDLTPEEFVLVLDTAARQKAAWRDGVHDAPCTGKAVAIIMEKPSLRTRSSFEIGTYRLGAHPLVMSDDHSAFSRGETVQDTTLVLERFVDAIVLRTFEQEKVEEVARWASVPVINALTDEFHPCQGLADALTIREHKGALAGLTIAYVGDGNNMAHTYLEMGGHAREVGLPRHSRTQLRRRGRMREGRADDRRHDRAVQRPARGRFRCRRGHYRHLDLDG